MSPLVYDTLTYNICNVHPGNITKAGASVEKYGWAARAGRVFSVIKAANASFVACQEIRDQETKEGKLERLEGQFYQNLGSEYGFQIAANNADRWSFKLLTAHKTDQYVHVNSYQWWNNSVNPERFGDTSGNVYGRVSLMTKYYPVKTDTKGVKQPNYEEMPVYVLNMHPGLKHAERMEHHKVAFAQIKKIIGLEKAILFVMGDFNPFPDDGGDQELALWVKEGFVDVKNLVTTTGLPIPGTWLGYPAYDKFVPPKGQVGTQLDRTFIKVMNADATITYEAKVDINKYDGTDEAQPKSVEACLVDKDGKDLRSEMPSDHAALRVRTTIVLK